LAYSSVLVICGKYVNIKNLYANNLDHLADLTCIEFKSAGISRMIIKAFALIFSDRTFVKKGLYSKLRVYYMYDSKSFMPGRLEIPPGLFANAHDPLWAVLQ
jgi:hypothetical protein